MTDHDNSQGEPTMEEILASIRRIISEDNDESESEAAKPDVKDTASRKISENEGTDRREAEVLELSPAQMVQEDKPAPAVEPKPNGFDKAASEEASGPSAEPKREETAEPARPAVAAGAPRPAEPSGEVEETLLSPEVATAAAAAFGALSKDVTMSRGGKEARSLEELVQEMMKPMLKEWLDENLPPLVEEVVEREVRRLSHRRARR